MDAQTLIARQAETAVIEAFLDRSGPRGLLLEGEAGIGKTRVWAAGVEASREHGMVILTARASGAEVRLSFAVLSDLLDRLPATAFASLPVPQQRALDAALLRADVPSKATAGRAVGQALLSVLRLLAAESPVLVAVDDLQWVDPPSGGAVMFALRRLTAEPVAVLATARTEGGDPPPLELERMLPDGRLKRVRIGPLSESGVGELLRSRLGLNLSRAALMRLHERAGGNPFYALEIGRLLGSARIEAEQELPVPPSLSQLVHERLAQLPTRTRVVLLAASGLSQPRVELLGPTAEEDLRPAVDAGIVSLEGDVVVFAHPLFAFVPYEAASAADRRRLHARLARVVSEGEERARHLALAASRPDERVAAELDRAARRAVARGAPDTAAELAGLARRLTPGSDVDRLLAEAEYTFESGDSARARSLMEEAVARLEPGPQRAHARARLAFFRGGWGDDPYGALALMDGAVEEASRDLAVIAEVYECLTWHCHLVGRHDDATRFARLGADAAGRLDEPRWMSLLGFAVALAEGKAGRATQAHAAMARVETLSGSVESLRVIDDPGWVRAIFRASAGDLQGARALTGDLHQRALELGDESSLPNLLEHLALFEFQSGDWQRADELIDTAIEIAIRTDQNVQRLALLPWRAFIHAHLGRVESARATAVETIAETEERGLPMYCDAAHWALMRLALANDDHRSALLEFNQLRHPRRGMGEHTFFRHYGDAAQALAASGEPAAAATMVRRWRACATALDRAAAGPGGDRCTGAIAIARGDFGRGLTLLERAVERGRRLPEPFELGLSLLALGTARRQARQKRLAAASLTEAYQLFDRLPAPQWAERARREMRRIGGRRLNDGALTEMERRVAALAASGRANAQVARELSVSRKTVEWNLSKVYRKLGVRSRVELAAMLASQN